MSRSPEISTWFDSGVAQNATHLLVVDDLEDHEMYPIYIKANEQFWSRYDCLHGKNKQSVYEVFDLRDDKTFQFDSLSPIMRTPPR